MFDFKKIETLQKADNIFQFLDKIIVRTLARISCRAKRRTLKIRISLLKKGLIMSPVLNFKLFSYSLARERVRNRNSVILLH